MMKVLVLILAIAATATAENSNKVNDGQLSLLEILSKYGYPSEAHNITTEDGYILTTYRIPYGKKCGLNGIKKTPILLQHGFLSSSIDWIIAGVDSGLGYLLADICYDVWLGNSRGNFESQNHINLTKLDKEFWQFSWHEMAKFDLPAVINYILAESGAEKLHYVGHSQGTTIFFAYAAMYPDESFEKITSMHGFAPVAYAEHISSPVVRMLAQNYDALTDILDIVGLGEFIPQKDPKFTPIASLCEDTHPGQKDICSNLLFLLYGFDSVQWNATLFPIIAGHSPAGASTMQMKHYIQEVISGHFRQYDHGEFENINRYGQITPPDYELGDIKVPLYLWYGENDWIATVPDIERLAAETSTSVTKKVPFPKFNHIDFLFALDVRNLLYNPLMEILGTYESKLYRNGKLFN